MLKRKDTSFPNGSASGNDPEERERANKTIESVHQWHT